MLKTVIVTPPTQDWTISPFPNLGPSILKTFLDSKGYKTDWIDLSVRVRYLNRFLLRKIFNLYLFVERDRVINFLENGKDIEIEEEIEKLIKLGDLAQYDVIGFSLHDDPNVIFSLCLAKILKEKYSKKIVFGGPIIIRGDYEGLLDFDFIDFLIAGDGEKPFMKVLRYFEGKGSVENCDGIFYKKNGKKRTNKPSQLSLANKPAPTFNIDDLKLYRKLSTRGLSILPYLLTRGCKFKCAFCTEYKNVSFNSTPVKKVISDIKGLLKNYHPNLIYFAEANMFNDLNYIRELSKAIIRSRLHFLWGGFATISDLQEETIKLMAKSGCKYLSLGTESASEPILEKMRIRKVGNLETFKETLKLLHKYGIRVHIFFIVEFPHETDEDFKKSVDFVKETAKYTTTAAGSMFQLMKSSPVFLVPQAFKVRIRNRNMSRYNVLDRWLEFDEINGLKWRQKLKRGKRKEIILNKITHKRVGLGVTLRSSIKDPLYVIKKRISHPYTNYDEYLL